MSLVKRSLCTLLVFYFNALLFSTEGVASSNENPTMDIEWFRPNCSTLLNVRVVKMEPQGKPTGDILFLHGFADRADNHKELFSHWVQAGYRVISFDLPSHGETTGFWGIDFFTFRALGKLALEVEGRHHADRPLFLAGWSTGGLLAARMLQMDLFRDRNRAPSGVFLIAPGISVRWIVGEGGAVTEASLTSNPNPQIDHAPYPSSPFLRPVFALRLLLNSTLSNWRPYPSDVPTFIALGGNEEDRYVNSASIESWVRSQLDRNSEMWSFRFEGAFHMLDKELEHQARLFRYSQAFFDSIVTGQSRLFPPPPGIYSTSEPWNFGNATRLFVH